MIRGQSSNLFINTRKKNVTHRTNFIGHYYRILFFLFGYGVEIASAKVTPEVVFDAAEAFVH